MARNYLKVIARKFDGVQGRVEHVAFLFFDDFKPEERMQAYTRAKEICRFGSNRAVLFRAAPAPLNEFAVVGERLL